MDRSKDLEHASEVIMVAAAGLAVIAAACLVAVLVVGTVAALLGLGTEGGACVACLCPTVSIGLTVLTAMIARRR